MGTYIKGMEMPENCCACNFSSVVPGEVWCKLAHAIIPDDQALVAKRPECCPLIPVPPHGRLIDADALGQSIKESIDECHKWANAVESRELYARVSQSLGTFVELSLRVKAAPTIIPASEEGE